MNTFDHEVPTVINVMCDIMVGVFGHLQIMS